MVYEIHTYGGGDILVQILTGAKLILGSPAFTTLIGVIALLGLLIFIAYLSFSFRWEISWFLWLVIAYLGLFAPKADVAVIDHLQPGNTQVVTGVPALLGYFGHISSAVGDGLTRLMEQAFSLPGGLAFRATGYAAPLHAIQAGLNEGIPEPYVASSATQYIKNCVFYDLLDGTKLASAILKSPDLLSAFESDHPSRFTETLIAADGSEITGHPDVVKCVAGYQRLRNGMNRIYGTWWNRFVRSVSGARDLPAVDVEPVLTLSYQRLMNIAATPQEIIFQSAMIHAYDEALELQAKATGSTEELLGMTLAQAEYQQRTGLFTMGRMARHLLPALRSVVEALIYGIFPFLLLMLFLPWGYKVLQTYAVGFLWLQLWGPIFAVLNLLTAIRAEKILKPYASEGVTIMTWATLDTMTADQLAMAGAISLMVPILAYFLASGSLSGIIQGAGMVLGSSQSTAGRAASSAGMGNISMGNVGLDNFQANKFNPAVESTTGWRETVYGVMGGNAFQPARYGYVTPEGGATQLALSSLGGGISLQTGKRADLLQQESYNRTWEQAQEAFDQKATQYRDAISRTSGREARTGSEYGYTKSSEKGVSSDKGRRADIATQFADQVRREYGLSADESRDVVVRALAARSLALDGGVGFGTARLFGLGGKLGAGIVGRKEDQEQSKVGSRHQDAFNHIFDATTSEQVREAISLFERAQSSTQGRHAETASTGM
ncbi:MAG: conjugal transfer protein TraG N-terminal domain-containing protein, partial [Nitrospiria bacterium]